MTRDEVEESAKAIAMANGHHDAAGWADKVGHIFETGELPPDPDANPEAGEPS